MTVFAILATRNAPTADPRLNNNVKAQLRKILPDHGFKLLDVQSKNIEVNQSLTCDLGGGYTAETTLVKSLDENGKVQLRCKVAHDKVPEFTTLVKTPVNQLFFYERSLKNGTRVLIGVVCAEFIPAGGIVSPKRDKGRPWPLGPESQVLPWTRPRYWGLGTRSSLTGSVFQPTWVVSEDSRGRLQAFCLTFGER